MREVAPIKNPKEHWNAKISRNRPKEWSQKMVQTRKKLALAPQGLRKLREEKGLSQIAFADQLGLSYTTYGDIERGARRLNRASAMLILKELGIGEKRLQHFFKMDGKRKYRVIA